MIWLVLLLLLGAPALANATIYYADPAGSGVASCVDTGANVCTIARAEAVATHGDTVQAACGTYDMGATALTIDVNITIGPVTDRCATITGSNATAPVILTVANDANVLTFGAFIITPTGSASRGISITDVAYSRTLILSGTQPMSGVNSAINSLWLRGTEKYLNLVASGTMGAQGWLRIQAMATTASKTVLIDGVTGSLTTGTSGDIAIWLERSTTTPQPMYVAVRNVELSLTLPAALGTSASMYGIYVKNIAMGPDPDGTTARSVVESNTLTIDAPNAPSGGVEGIYVFATNATANGNNFLIRNNTVTSNEKAGGLIRIGANTALTSYHTDSEMYGNSATCTVADGSSTPHGIVVGNSTSVTAWGNSVTGCPAALLSSLNTTVIFTGNLVVGTPYVGLFAKGNTSATFSNNTVIMDDAVVQAKFGNYGCLGVAVQGATNNSATTFSNNNCYVKSGAAWDYVVVDASQVATFNANNYYSAVALSGNTWSYQGSATAALATWNANATVGTDLNADPLFVSATDYRVRAGSPLMYTGANGLPCRDYRGRACYLLSPNIGAYQASSGDPAATRAVRN